MPKKVRAERWRLAHTEARPRYLRYALLALALAATACDSGTETGATQPSCCDAGADATGVATDAADGSATDGAGGSGISDADASLDLEPPRDEGGRSDIAEDGLGADVDRDAPPPIVDGTPPSDGPDGTPPADGPDGTPRTDGPVDNPACPLRNPDPVVCADPDAGSPETRWVECTPLNPRTVATASYPASLKMDAQGIYWTAGFGEIYMLSNGASSPTMIVKARAVNEFHGFQLDDNAIYFDEETDGGRFTVTSIRRDGTARTALATSARGTLAIDSERLYIGDDGRIAWIPKSGGTPVATPMPIPEGRLFLRDDTHFYWFEGPADDRTLKRWARNAVSSETIVDHQGSVFWMIQDATHLYWLMGPEYQATGIRRVAKNGTTAETLTSDLNTSVGAFIEQGDGLLLVARGGIVEVPKTGGCPRVLVTPPWLYRIWWSPVADNTSIYWQAGYGSDTFKSSLWRAPRSGGVAARLIAPGALPEPGGTYLTPTQIWWTTSMAISVMDRF